MGIIGGVLARQASRTLAGLTGVLTAVLVHFTYFTLILILITAGSGLPIPEDIPLILSGYLCNRDNSPIPQAIDKDGDGIKETPIERHLPNLYVMMIAGMVGVLAGDSIVFSIGRRGMQGNSLIARHLQKVMHSKRREKLERHFAKHGNLTVFVGRFVFGIRAPIFALAGMSKMSYFRFLLINGLAAGISVPLFVFIGYYFAGDINWLFALIDRVKHIVFPVLAILLLGAAALWYVRRKRAAAARTTEPVI